MTSRQAAQRPNKKRQIKKFLLRVITSKLLMQKKVKLKTRDLLQRNLKVNLIKVLQQMTVIKTTLIRSKKLTEIMKSKRVHIKKSKMTC